MNWYAFYTLATGAIVSVSEMTPQDADAAVLADPTLGYALAPGNVDPDDYFIADGLLLLKPAPPVTPDQPVAKTYAFFMTTDGTGTILFTLKGTQDDAEISVTDAAMDYVEAPDSIDPADYYIASGVLTARPQFAPVVSKTTITANGIDMATVSGLPTNTQVTVQTADLSPFATSDTRDFYGAGQNTGAETSFTVKTFHKLPHNFLLEKFPYRPKMVTIYGN